MTQAMTAALVAIAGTAFGAWPLITRGSKLHFLPAGFALQFGTMMTFMVFICVMCVALEGAGLRNAFHLEDGRQLVWVALLAGLVNGLGQLAMQKLVASSSGVEISVVATATLAIMAVVYMIGGWVVYHEPMTLRKIAGTCSAIVALWLLMGK